ncbi:MAG: hypothetical protein A4E53_00153 [Pelotomaculum sp. PtaB.Bin104]|nr:MAG: hypothetical protein A4E53_00153 [Pelotomaculum sp. PtaB.Bin104]
MFGVDVLGFDFSRFKGMYPDVGGSGSGDGGAASTADPGDSNISIGEGQAKFTGGETDIQQDDSVVAGQKEQKPIQTPEQDKAFADLRRRAEAAERKIQQYNQIVQQNFGQTHGLNDMDSYFNAVNQTLQQQQVSQQQQVEKYRSEKEAQLESQGYNVREIREIFRTDPVFIRMNQENQALKRQLATDQQQRQQERLTQQIMADHVKLRDKYGDLVPDLQDLDDNTVALIKQGIPLRAAWLQANEDAILEHAKTTTKAKTIRDIGSKNHLDTEKGGAGEFEAQIDLSNDELRTWRGIFGKKLTVAQIKEKVSKYRKAAKK